MFEAVDDVFRAFLFVSLFRLRPLAPFLFSMSGLLLRPSGILYSPLHRLFFRKLRLSSPTMRL